ncbi:MAG: PQQ-binding-like beta-propeller repeat protein [Enhygromyxa sp.]
MDLISVDCPSCGARLPPQDPGGAYQCSYCGSGFRLEQAKKAQTQAGVAIDPHQLAQAILAAQRQAQAEQAMPPVNTYAPPVPPPRPAKTAGCISVMAVIPLLAMGIGAAVFMSKGGPELIDRLPAQLGFEQASEHLLWDKVGGVPQVVTVNGASAVVGRTRAVGSGDHLYCGVHDTSGQAIWRTESLGTYSAGYQSTFCGAAGDALIATDQRAVVRIFDLATGAQRHELELSDVVDYLCTPQDPEQTQVWIKQIDERTHLLDPATGELTPSEQPSWCFESRHEAEKALQGGGGWSDANSKGAPKVQGLKLEFVYQRDDKAVALGHTEPGTKVPTALGFDPNSKQVLWQQPTPSVPKATVRDADKYGAIAKDKFVTTYGAGQEDWYITALDLATGNRVWETKLRGLFAVDRIQGMVASDSHVFVVRTSSLEIFDAQTGKLTGTVGKETYD